MVMVPLLSSCACNNSQGRQGGEEQKTVSIVETADSVYLNGVLSFADSSTLAFVKQRRYETYSDEDNQETDAPSLEWRIPSGLKWVRIPLGKDINGYDVEVKLFPDGDYYEVGYARYRFSSHKGVLEVDTGFFWDWKSDVEGGFEDDIRYGGTYELKQPLNSLVQGDTAEIEQCVFCFKDVDFDGEKELCFRAIGFNREYYNCYKVVGGRIRQMVGRPYNNIVYGTCGNTVFDYEGRSITVWEEMGASVRCNGRYVLRDKVIDPLDPMWQEEEQIRTIQGDGSIVSVNQRGGRITGESYECYGIGFPHPIIADYERDSVGTYHLTSISFLQGDDQILLYDSSAQKCPEYEYIVSASGQGRTLAGEYIQQ